MGSVVKTITKPISHLFKEASKVVFGKPPKVKSYAQSPTQRYAENIIRDIISKDKTPQALKRQAVPEYTNIKNLIMSILSDTGGLKSDIRNIKQDVASTYDDVISKMIDTLAEQIASKNRSLAALGLLNTPMVDYVTSEVINKSLMPLYQKKADAITEAVFKTPAYLMDTDKMRLATIDALIGAFDWYSKYQMLPIETKRALIQSLLGTSGEPVIDTGSKGILPDLIKGGAMILAG